MMTPLCAALWLLLLLPALCSGAAAGKPAAAPPQRFPVFAPCSRAAGDGTDQGLCRAQPWLPQRLAAGPKAKPKEMPIDMRLPCEEAEGSAACHENVDVTVPAMPLTGPSVRACNITLMPWSPFPCRYDPASSTGVPGQRVDYCYSTAPAGPGGPAVSLETDGYNNVYRGRSPADGAAPCGGDSLAGVADAGDVRLLLRVDFRLAAGRQYDRTYHFQIGDAVAAFGTCSEPARVKAHDKRWSAVVDVTHLRSYLRPGQPTRFSLSNVLSNVYNVPLWAAATLEVYYKDEGPPPAVAAAPAAAGVAALEPKPLAPATAARAQAKVKAGPASAAAAGTPPRSRLLQKHAGGKACALPPAGAPPDEVVPLVPPGRGQGDDNAVFVLSGSGDSPKHWPSATFPLAPFESGDVYRAQLVVTPKANGCEEFWAMNPSGARTGGTCGGLSTGEPYREVRVRLDGTPAGFAPVRYTMYSGGCDPRLWSAVVGHPMFVLPQYTFDLSPWLGVLNAPAPAAAAAVTKASAAAKRAASKRSKRVDNAKSSSGSSSEHSVSVELAGAAGADWHMAAELRLWRAPGRRITAAQEQPSPRVSLSPPPLDGGANGGGAWDTPASECAGANLTDAGVCALRLRPRRLLAEAALEIDGEPFDASAGYRLGGYESEVAWNNTGGFASWAARIRGYETSWLFGRRGVAAGALRAGILQQQQTPALRPKAAAAATTSLPDAVSSGMRRDEWLHTGGIALGHPFEFSHNFTLTSVQARVPPADDGCDDGSSAPAAVASASQRHYQRLLMLEIYGSSAPPLPTPTYATHTASLNSSSSSSQGSGSSCVAWEATAAWGAPAPMSSDLRVVDGGGECAAAATSRVAPKA